MYQFTCQFCQQAYIGQTSRPFLARLKEHTSSLKAGNNNSALSEHAKYFHRRNMTIKDFNLMILSKHNSPIESRITEARYIRTKNPGLNRKQELVG